MNNHKKQHLMKHTGLHVPEEHDEEGGCHLFLEQAQCYCTVRNKQSPSRLV